MSEGKITWARYVAFADIPRYLALGWEWDADAPPLHAPHGCYRVLMIFAGAGKPPEPIGTGEPVEPAPDDAARTLATEETA